MSAIYDGQATEYGYARVSTHEQNLGLQFDTLERAACDQIFTDKASGVQDDRAGLLEALGVIQEGDPSSCGVLTVCDLQHGPDGWSGQNDIGQYAESVARLRKAIAATNLAVV